MRLTRSILFGLTAALSLALAGCPEDEPTNEDVCSPACSGTTPVCDEATKTCKTCTATEGCSGGQVCDLSVAKGECVECTSDTQCDQAAPICDTGINECVVCTALVGCGNGQDCDTNVAGGRCVSAGCTANSQCTDTAKPVCNTNTGICVVCTATEGCEDGESCVNNACVADTECTASTECAAPTPVCDTVAGTCVVCKGNEGCEADETCTDGACVPNGCSGNTDCSGTTPKCNTTTHACVECLAKADCGATEECNASNVCVPAGCTTNTDCSGATPKCNTTTHACVECLAPADCDANENCTGNVCVPEAADPSAQIAAVRAAAPTTVNTETTGLSLPITGATVTYVKQAVGNDAAGFVLQAAKTGPAIFVQVDMSTLTPAPAVGDKVNLNVTTVKLISGSLTYATAISNYSRVSTGNSIDGLVQDVSAATDLVSAVGDYEFELVRATGTIAGAFSSSGGGYVAAKFSTAGIADDASLLLRVPATLQTSAGLATGCSLTLNKGLMWRFTNASSSKSQLLANVAAELTSVTCPAPAVVSAAASAATTVTVTFDMDLLASSVTAGAFTIAPSLAVTDATVAGKVVTLTTAAQTASTNYTVTVANTVKSAAGTALGSSNSASFTGFDPGATTSAQVVISQIYGAGGNSGAAYKLDFVELHNRGNSAAPLSGWSLQYTSATGTAWTNKVDLTGTIPAGGYYLVSLSGGTNGADLPVAADQTGSINLSGTKGKVALASVTSALTTGCPTADIIDFVGFGTADCYEGAAAPAPTDNVGVMVRAGNGCTDKNNNSTDFTVETTVAPRNMASTALVCQ